MRLRKLMILVMFVGLLAALVLPCITAPDINRCTLEIQENHNSSIRDMATPGLQLLTSKSKGQQNLASSGAIVTNRVSAIIPPCPHKQAGQQLALQAAIVRPLWIVNQAMLI